VVEHEAQHLTPRERDVLRLLCCGTVRNRDLAEQLVLSESTVEYHVKNVLAKVGASSRAQSSPWLSQGIVAR